MNTIITNEGWKILDPACDLISGWIVENKRLDHDAFLPVVAVNNIVPGSIVIDCGAHVGSHAIAYSRKLAENGEEGHLICIEAGATQFECLTHNAEKFECKTTLINACVSDVHGKTAKFTVSESNAGSSFTTEKNGSSEVDSNEVPTITLDRLCEDGGIFTAPGDKKISLIKIDVEGFEYKVLLGAHRILTSKQPPKLLIEMNSFRLEENGSSYKEIYDHLLSLGYSWQILEAGAKGGDLCYNIMAWPRAIIAAKTLPAG